MLQAYRRLCVGIVMTLILSGMPLLAWDDCADVIKGGETLFKDRGACASLGSAPDGKMIDGLRQCRDASGKVVEEARYEKGVPVSLWFYDAEDRLLSFVFNEAGKLHGPARGFSRDGVLACEMFFTDGKPEGAGREYYPNGKLRRSYTVRNGRKDGRYLEYDENGGLLLEREYRDGVDWVEKFYDPNGNLREHSLRKGDGKSFTSRHYWPNGKLRSEASFEVKTKPACKVKEAVLVGKAFQYAEDGSLRKEESFDDLGRLDGLQIDVDEEGRRTESVYCHGRLTQKRLFAPDGKLQEELVFGKEDDAGR